MGVCIHIYRQVSDILLDRNVYDTGHFDDSVLHWNGTCFMGFTFHRRNDTKTSGFN